MCRRLLNLNKFQISSAMNGEFRLYKEKRKFDMLVEFIREKKWEKVEPLPSWKSPGSIL
jgi:hypothetical protein